MRPYVVPLGVGPEPADVVAALRDLDQPAVLWGAWFGGGVIIMRAPLRAQPLSTAAEVTSMIDNWPADTGGDPGSGLGDPEDGSIIGGGWLGCLGFTTGTSSAAFYDHVLRWRAREGWWFESLGLSGREAAMAAELKRWRDLLGASARPGRRTATVGLFRTRLPPAAAKRDYLGAVDRTIGMIDAGEVYQLNLCTRLHAALQGSPIELFARAAAQLEPAYGALLIRPLGPDDAGPRGGAGGSSPPESTQQRQGLASFSPELFLRVRGRAVTTAPIKGTAPRQPGEDDSPALRASAKDAAENIMIVDLMRNDLSRVCRPGTVRVDNLLSVQPHPGVWHLVSTVTGRLVEGVSAGELLAATFPPGSVTGAPKSAALRGIVDLEPERRGAYTGALGLSSPLAGADFSVIIRTLEFGGDELQLGVGGGITVDSVPINEWYECLTKAAPVVRAAGGDLERALRPTPPQPTDRQLAGGVLETMLAIGGNVLRLAPHLSRLDRSCRELYGRGLPDDLAGRVLAAVAAAGGDPGSGSAPARRRAVRVIARAGREALDVDISLRLAGSPPATSQLALLRRSPTSWRHKWADRAELAATENQLPAQLPYFVAPANDGGHVVETSRGNLFCLIDGVWLTPPLDENLLPGVTRRDVLDLMARHRIPLRIDCFTVEEFRGSAAAFWTSSLSGAVPVSAVDGHPLAGSDDIVALINSNLGIRAGAGRLC
jgi:para-aminobenzoate synthetase/4-amino-4-deoxychorismate lyase